MNQATPAAQLESLLSTQHRALVTMLDRRIPDELRAAVGAEDVAQEAAMEAFRSLDTFRPAGGDSLRGWLWQIARHRLCDLVRAHRRLKRGGGAARSPLNGSTGLPLDAVAAAPDCPVQTVSGSETREALRRALAELPADYCQVIQLRYVQDLSIAETADRLGRTPGATAVLCNRALKLLRRALQSDAAGPIAA
jgi:RNA polymerase sigma-70 factor, ECF subfamily